MTVAEVAQRFVNDPEKGVTPLRVQKLKAACARLSVSYALVLAALPVGVQQQIASIE